MGLVDREKRLTIKINGSDASNLLLALPQQFSKYEYPLRDDETMSKLEHMLRRAIKDGPNYFKDRPVELTTSQLKFLKSLREGLEDSNVLHLENMNEPDFTYVELVPLLDKIDSLVADTDYE